MYVITVPNLLEPEKSFKTEHEHTSVIDYLQFQYPDGFKVPHVIYRNSKKVEVEDYDLALGRDDFIVIAFSPAAPLLVIAAPYLIKFAVAAAISYIIGEIFKPDIPSGALSSGDKTENSNVSSVYNLSSGQNRVALGQPIPSIYGRARVYPNIIEQPYYRFQSNELFLYQMMSISVGDVAIEELLVVDTPETDLAPDDLLSRTFRNDKFDAGEIKTAIGTEFGDDAYHMRVKTLPEVSGLELRGTPALSSFIMRFKGTDITFYTLANGDDPDLSSLVNGSEITVSGTDNGNDGTYIASGSPTGLVVPIASKVDDGGWTAFTTEPSDTPVEVPEMYHGNDCRAWFADPVGADAPFNFGKGITVNINSVDYLQVDDTGILEPCFLDDVHPDLLYYVSGYFTATFETSYGAYTLEDTPSTLDSIEVDIEYPRGIYNSNATTGVFEDRTILLEYKLIGSSETLWIDINDNGETYTEINKTNTPQRRTYNLPVPSGLTDDTPLKIRLRRSSPEVADTRSQDQAIVTRIKSIYNEPDINDYGNITLLWVRAKASNAISSAGQFQINAWVNRQDVLPDLTSVITDIYTNTEYGAGLNGSDLILPDMSDTEADNYTVFNGALDTKTTVMDTLRMIGKAGRYTVYLDGQNVKMRKDEIQLIRTALYNETNILKDSFKLDYLFGEDDGFDGISVKYRDPIDFKEAIATYPDTSSNPEVTELIGCTDFQIALAEATYGWLQKESRRKVVSFSTDIQGILPNYLDRIGVTHNTPDWGLGGQIAAVNGNQITMDCRLFTISSEIGDCADDLGLCTDIFCVIGSENTDYDTIIFRNKDGSVSELFSFTIVSEYDIILDITPPTWLYTGNDYDRTFFSIGVSNKFVKDYIVTEITPRGNNVVDVRAVNYDPTVYVQPTLVDGFGLELTDGAGNLLN